MDNKEIEVRLRKIFSHYSRDMELINSMTRRTNILVDLRVHSARYVDLMLDVEDEFEIEIDDSRMNEIFTVGNLIDTIKMELQK